MSITLRESQLFVAEVAVAETIVQQFPVLVISSWSARTGNSGLMLFSGKVLQLLILTFAHPPPQLPLPRGGGKSGRK